VEADDGRGRRNPLTLVQLHKGSCTKVTVKRNRCLLLQRSVAYHISLYQWTTLFGVQAASALCRPWLFALCFRLLYGYFHIQILDPKFDIRISGYRLTTLLGKPAPER